MTRGAGYLMSIAMVVLIFAGGCETSREGVKLDLAQIKQAYRAYRDPQPSREHVEAFLALMTPEQHNDLGVMLERDGRLAEAKKAYEEAIAKDYRFVRAYVNLGNVHRKLGEEEMACQRYRQALVLEPKNFEAANNFADLSAARGEHIDLSIEYLARCLPESGVRRAYGLDTLGWLQHLKGAQSAAEQSLTEALRLTDDSRQELRAVIWEHLVSVYEACGRQPEAAQARAEASACRGGAARPPAAAKTVDQNKREEGR